MSSTRRNSTMLAEPLLPTASAPAAAPSLAASRFRSSVVAVQAAPPPSHIERLRSFAGNLFATVRKTSVVVHGEVDEYRTVTIESLANNTQLLMMASAFFVIHMSVGCLWYTQLAGWTLLDAAYFSIVTITTVGYGDVTPMTQRDKLFTCAYILVGVFFIGTAVGVMVACAAELMQQRRKASHAHAVQADAAAAANAGASVPSSAGFHRGSLLRGFLRRLDDTLGLPDHYRSLLLSGLRICCWMSLGATFFVFVEDYDWTEALYFTTVSLATVGYGDYTPKTHTAKAFCCGFLLLGSVLMGAECFAIAQMPLTLRTKRLERRVLEQYGEDLQVEELLELCRNVAELGLCRHDRDASPQRRHLQSISRSDFTLQLLVHMGKLQEDDIVECLKAFDKLDATGDGVLNVRDVENRPKSSLSND